MALRDIAVVQEKSGIIRGIETEEALEYPSYRGGGDLEAAKKTLKLGRDKTDSAFVLRAIAKGSLKPPGPTKPSLSRKSERPISKSNGTRRCRRRANIGSSPIRAESFPDIENQQNRISVGSGKRSSSPHTAHIVIIITVIATRKTYSSFICLLRPFLPLSHLFI
jgi:hypothetical protein